eukprot:COSAG02_NODE_8455_length_2566_cov_1.753141_1_plen_462_part_10
MNFTGSVGSWDATHVPNATHIEIACTRSQRGTRPRAHAHARARDREARSTPPRDSSQQHAGDSSEASRRSHGRAWRTQRPGMQRVNRSRTMSTSRHASWQQRVTKAEGEPNKLHELCRDKSFDEVMILCDSESAANLEELARSPAEHAEAPAGWPGAELPPLYWAALANAPSRVLVKLSMAWPDALSPETKENKVFKTLMSNHCARDGHVQLFIKQATPEMVAQAKQSEWSQLLEKRQRAAWPLLLAAECSAPAKVIEQLEAQFPIDEEKWDKDDAFRIERLVVTAAIKKKALQVRGLKPWEAQDTDYLRALLKDGNPLVEELFADAVQRNAEFEALRLIVVDPRFDARTVLNKEDKSGRTPLEVMIDEQKEPHVIKLLADAHPEGLDWKPRKGHTSFKKRLKGSENEKYRKLARTYGAFLDEYIITEEVHRSKTARVFIAKAVAEEHAKTTVCIKCMREDQ